jgi:RNA polymerase sigma factor (TIGR02999 family)
VNGDAFPMLYDELRRLAEAKLRSEKHALTLNATALVHEAYLRLAGQLPFENKALFFSAAAEAMRRILIEAARRRLAAKRGGNAVREPLDDALPAPQPDDELLALNDALEQFEARYPDKAQLVKLRYFVGLTADEAAAALGISSSTGDRHWIYARAWLLRAMKHGP